MLYFVESRNNFCFPFLSFLLVFYVTLRSSIHQIWLNADVFTPECKDITTTTERNFNNGICLYSEKHKTNFQWTRIFWLLLFLRFGNNTRGTSNEQQTRSLAMRKKCSVKTVNDPTFTGQLKTKRFTKSLKIKFSTFEFCTVYSRRISIQ